MYEERSPQAFNKVKGKKNHFKMKPSELKQAYQLVSQDLVHHLAKIKEGDKILLPQLGTFVKTKQKVKD